MRRLLFSLSALLIFLAACGDDDDGTAIDDQADVSGTEEFDSDRDAVSALPAECPEATPFTVEARLAGDGDLVALEIAGSAAVIRAEGRAITVYLSDVELPDDTSWSFSTPDVGETGTLISTGLDHFNVDPAEVDPLDVGDSGPLFKAAGDGATATFLSVQGPDADTSSANMAGETELLHIDAEKVCFRTSILSDSGSALSGVYSAPVVAEI